LSVDPGDFSRASIAELVQESLFPLWQAERRKMQRLDRWHRNNLLPGLNGDLPELKKSTPEYKRLQEICKTPWARLVVNSTVDVLHLQGIVDGSGETATDLWRVWEANGMDGRQSALWEGATALGRAYVTALPGRDPLTGESIPRLKVSPATQTLTFYEDPANDDWPLYAMIGRSAKKQDGSDFWRMKVFDDEWVYTVDYADGKATYITREQHGAGVVPVVQFAPNIDLEGRATGEVEPYIDMISRMNQTTLDRHIVERFGAWVVRWATGLQTPVKEDGTEDVEAKQALKLKLSIEDILVSSGKDTRFGTLEGTPMEPYIRAEEWQARNLAVISQASPAQFVGQVENLSADAIAMLNAPHRGKVARHKTNFGEQAERLFRLIGVYQNIEVDFSSQVLWRDSESRSLAQLADALGKLVDSLQIPPDQFWSTVAQALGRPQQDVEKWRSAAENPDELSRLLMTLSEGLE